MNEKRSTSPARRTAARARRGIASLRLALATFAIFTTSTALAQSVRILPTPAPTQQPTRPASQLNFALSPDATRMVFASTAGKLVPNDDSAIDTYVRTLATGRTVRISQRADGTPATRSNTGFIAAAASANVVAFISLDRALVSPPQSGSGATIYRYDLDTGTLTRAALPSFGTTSQFALSPDGDQVCFVTTTSLVAADQNDVSDVYLHTFANPTATLLSIGPIGVGNGASTQCAFSLDGVAVTFRSVASNLVANDTNGVADIFARTLLNPGSTVRLSLGPGNAELPTESARGILTGVGTGNTFVYFENAGRLTTGDNDTRLDVYRRRLSTGEVKRMSVRGTAELLDDASVVMVSRGGREVLFQVDDQRDDRVFARRRYLRTIEDPSTGTLTTGTLDDDEGDPADVAPVPTFMPVDPTGDNVQAYLVTGATVRGQPTIVGESVVVRDPASRRVVPLADARLDVRPLPNGDSYFPALSADGTRVAFYTLADNLLPGDTGGVGDIVLLDRATGALTPISDPAESFPSHDIRAPAITPDGNFVAFSSRLVTPGGTLDGLFDVFVYDVDDARLTLASNATGAFTVPNTGDSSQPDLSDDGNLVVFASRSNAIGGGSPVVAFEEIFLRDRRARTTTRLTLAAPGIAPNGPSTDPHISGDGRIVTFCSDAANLTGTASPTALVVLDRVAKTRRSVAVDNCIGHVLSDDGSRIAVPVPGAAPGLDATARFIDVETLATLATLTKPAQPTPSQGPATSFAISPDGRRLAALSGAFSSASPATEVLFGTLTSGFAAFIPITDAARRDVTLGRQHSLAADAAVRTAVFASRAELASGAASTPIAVLDLYAVDLETLFRDGFE